MNVNIKYFAFGYGRLSVAALDETGSLRRWSVVGRTWFAIGCAVNDGPVVRFGLINQSLVTKARLIEYKREKDDDFHLVIASFVVDNIWITRD